MFLLHGYCPQGDLLLTSSRVFLSLAQLYLPHANDETLTSRKLAQI